MIINKYKNTSELYADLAKKTKEEIYRKENISLGLAAGNSPIPLYKKLIEYNRLGEVDFSKSYFFSLDEFYGVDRKSKSSFYSFLFDAFYSKINLNHKNIFSFNGTCSDPEIECDSYEMLTHKHPIDLQILGLGVNGHIAFNEPGSLKDSLCRLVDLTESSVKSNASLFQGQSPPKKALTMGIATILRAKKIFLIAVGENKEEALNQLLSGEESSLWPVSYLKNHPFVEVFCLDKK